MRRTSTQIPPLAFLDDVSTPAAGKSGMQRMMTALAGIEFAKPSGSPLMKLCEAGARYGMEEFEATISPDLLVSVSPKARLSLKRSLRRDLARITRPCLELERTSFAYALQALGLPGQTNDPKFVDRRFLGAKPCDRLFPMFKRFPVLADLWFQLISQWRCHVIEVVTRFARDRRALSRAFFSSRPLRKIADLRCGLSDSHNNGRTVARLQCEAGSIIYKPRSGTGEWEWFSLLDWMNSHSFQPKLRAARVMRREGYCWMEHVEPASCKDEAAARRFYQRMGGMIAATYLLKAVDCHRDNVIANGEHPVLVDVDALWHVSPLTKTQSPADVLYRTGFFPNSNPRSLQSRSSVLGQAGTGRHLARIGSKPLEAACYKDEIVTGFARAWHCILGTPERRAAFLRRLLRIGSQERRWIHWATARYAAIKQASIQPAALGSTAERDLLIIRLCTRNTSNSELIDAEARALKQLDIPYFIRSTKEWMSPDKDTIAEELMKDIRTALRSM
jgi:lantibiotic modifying enzyme